MKRKVFSLMMLCLFAFLGLANAQVSPRDKGGIAITPDPVEMGYRPNGAWMRPFEAQLTNSSAAGETVTAIETTNEEFFIIDANVPAVVSSTKPLNFTIDNPDAPAGPYSAELVVWTNARLAYTFNISAVAYDPIEADVVETAPTATESFSATFGADIYDNYLLPGDEPDGKDVAYKLEIENDVLFNAQVVGANGKVALYLPGFNGQPGPGADNNFTGNAMGGDGGVVPYEAQVGPLDATTTAGYFPFYTLYNYSISENLFHADELLEAGMTTAPMGSISWYATNAPGYEQKNISIWMANVDDEVMTSTSHWAGDMTLVYEGDMTPAIGWNEFTFNRDAFAWDGTSNLLVCVQRNNGDWNSTVYWRSYNPGFVSQTYAYRDSSPFDMMGYYYTNCSTASSRAIAMFKSEGRDYRAVMSNINNMTLTPGEYYLLASSTSDEFTLNVNMDELPLPEPVANPFPADGDVEIGMPLTFTWELGQYTTEYRMILGTAYPPTEVVVDWTRNLAQSYTVTNLYNNTNYFWRIDERNSTGEVIGEIWGFTTTFNKPQNVVANPAKIYEGDVLHITWDGVVDRSYRGYNVYQDGVKLNTEVLTETAYDVAGLTYNMDGYTFNVTAVYDEGESLYSDDLMVYVTGNGTVSGKVTEQDGTTGIAGATVVFTGKDEFNANAVKTFTTAANGTYSGDILAGTYQVMAWKEGYQAVEREEEVTITYNTNTPNINFALDENWVPVGEVIAEEVDENLVKVYWSQNIMSEIIEDFETGDLSSFDWQNDATYPWVITSGGCNAESQYCLKSGNAGVASSTSSIQVSVDISRDGLMSFFIKPSTENNWDYGYFYIDGTQKGSYCGAGNWSEKEFAITTGTHTFKWAYTKDGSVNSNDDCIYLDNISFIHDPAPAETGWIGYDDGANQDAIGLTAGGSFYWGICFPASMMAGYDNFTMTKVKLYDYSAHTGKVMIYKGGTTAPGTLVTEQNYTCTGSSNYVELTLTNPIAIDPTQSIWVILNNFDGQYVAACCANSGDANGRWISMDGSEWMDLLEASSSLDYSWQIQAYVTDGAKTAPLCKEVAAAPVYTPSNLTFGSVSDLQGDPNWTPSTNRAFQHYNIYRTACSDMTGEDAEFLGSTNDTIYLEENWADMAPGIYKWGVSRFYEGNRGNRVTYDFESGDLQGWTSIDNDGDGNGWENWNSSGTVAHSGTGVAASASYINNVGALTPDNWLVSPQVELGGTMTFWAAGQDPSWASEHFGVYVSTSGTAVANFTQVLPETVATGTMTQYTVDLSSYSGNGYVAIRHYNITDMFRLNIDDITLGAGGDDPNPPTPPTPPVIPGGDMTYTGVHGESGVVWSNCLEHKMYVSPTINVTTNSGDDVTGTTVTLYNTSEPDLNLTYNVTLDETGTYTWESMRRGTYELNINLEGFIPVAETVEITDGTVLNYTLVEVLEEVGELYVSGTGWAMFGNMPAPTPVDPDDPPTPGEGQWYYYDDGTLATSIGTSSGSQFSWAVMFPAGSYTGNMVTKVQAYDASYPMTGDVTIYNGGTSEPGTAVGTMDITFTGAGDFVEFEFPTPVVIDPTQNLWVVFYNESGATYPAAASTDVTGDPNGRWVYLASTGWVDVAAAGVPGYCWMIRAYVASGAKGEVEEISVNHTYNMGGTLAKVDNPRSFEYYKVMLDGVLEGTTTHPFFQHDVENLVEGETYTTSVQKVYTTGESEWMTFDWVYTPCDNFEGLADGPTLEKQGDNYVINWTLPAGSDTPDDPDDPTPGETITADFEDGTLGDWTTIDADGDGNAWFAWTSTSGPQGHGGSVYTATSASYSSVALTPDNYLVSPAITLGGTLHFWACAQDASWAAEHFGVALSTTNNTSASAFTMITDEWVMTAKGQGQPTDDTRSGNRAQGQWYEYTVDLSGYSGTGYVAIRHFNCTDMFRLNVDDITYTAPGKGNRDVLFTDDFEDGALTNWTNIDNDSENDGGWTAATPAAYGIGNAHSGTYCASSWSWNNVSYDPDHWLISPQVTGAGSITYYVATNTGYPDHYAVMASTTGTNISDFTMVFEEDAPIAKGAAQGGAKVSMMGGGNREMSPWTQRNITLPAGTKYVAFRHYNSYDMNYLFIDDVTISGGGDTPDDPDDPTPDANVIGVEIFRDGEWIAEVLAPATSFTDVAPATEPEFYEVRVVYNGDTEDYTYYTMSCPEMVEVPEVVCFAPDNLMGQYVWNTADDFGALINWTYGEYGTWLYYGDGGVNSMVGEGSTGIPFYWGDMFPAEAIAPYANAALTEVAFVAYNSAGDPGVYTINIYIGGEDAPATLVHTQDYNFDGVFAGDYTYVTLTTPVALDPTQSLWITLYNDDIAYPAVFSTSGDTDPKGRLISEDGVEWLDVAQFLPQVKSWSLRGYITNAVEGGETVALAPHHSNSDNNHNFSVIEFTDEQPVFNFHHNNRTANSFNIYRNGNLIDNVNANETGIYEYYDQVAIGNYQYQVTAVYEDCESEFALTPDGTMNYVEVNVTDVNEFASSTKLYPNPTNGMVRIEASGITRLTVVNALGQVLYDAPASGDMTELNLGQYNAGVYMVRIASANGVSVKRVTLVK